MNDFDVFLEDENDIFQGSAKSKFFDVVRNASSEIVEDEIDKIIEKLAVLEMMLSENKSKDFDINTEIRNYKVNNFKEIETMKKGLYVEFTGEIICKLDS